MNQTHKYTISFLCKLSLDDPSSPPLPELFAHSNGFAEVLREWLQLPWVSLWNDETRLRELQHSQEPISKDMIHHDTPAGAKPKKETNLVQMFANFKLLLCLFMLIDLAKVDYQPAYFLAARRWVQRLGIIGVVGQKLCMFWTWRCLRSWMKASLNQNGCASDSKIGRV